MKKILIVEDDELLLQVVADKFESQGYDVHTAVDGSDGLIKFEKYHPDIVLVDIIMPKKSGIDMIAAVAEKYPDHPASIFVLTNNTETEIMAAAVSYEVAGYILKSEHELQRIVEIVEKKLKK